jgi:superfamily II DNA or RNA helicase
MTTSGIYESLITEILQGHLDQIKSEFYIERQPLDANEAALYISRFLGVILNSALDSLPNSDDRIARQIELSNALIRWLSDYLRNAELSENIIESQGQILTALFTTTNPVAADLKAHVAKITPLTGLAQSELFTGSNVSLSLESELKREILSCDEICWLVSFIKWTGIRVFAEELKEFTRSGRKMRVITTSYMGATDQSAVDFLAALPNTEVKLSYNNTQERLHAKAYIFLRNTCFDTGYIGTSNISRSALTNGLEWNLKVTTQEIPNIINKFKSTFETYWASPEFENYRDGDQVSHERLKKSLKLARGGDRDDEDTIFFDIEPHIHQKEILERLTIEREVHNRWRNLVVAATGTGKTIISAFDFRRFFSKNPHAKFLFVAHREEILKQARQAFRGVLRQSSFGELWVGSSEPEHYNQLFVSVQTLNNKIESLSLSSDFYDFIIIDEVHHIAAASYRPIINRFSPKILLGLTATPERNGGGNILEDFCGTIAAELRLPDAINRRYLCPFQYFGVDDTVDLSHAKWEKGRYLPSELTRIYRADDLRVRHIYRNMQDIIGDLRTIKCLAFCVSQEHAQFMAEQFLLLNVKTAVLTSQNSQERTILREQLTRGDINILFVVDIFNEGVDIPDIDTIVFLRPTESLTIFLQQLGRGLRLSEGKECLTVLDFVGNAHAAYDFASKFRALVGKSHVSTIDEVEQNFPHLPLGCSIILQKQAKEIILRSIKNAIATQRRLIGWIRAYPEQTNLPLTLKNFLCFNTAVTLEDIYKSKIDGGGGWNRLCIKAGILSRQLDKTIEQAMYRAIATRILQCTSRSYLLFLVKLIRNGFTWDELNPVENQMAMMAYYDFWQKPGKEYSFSSLQESMLALSRDASLISECQDVLEIILDSLDIAEVPMNIGLPNALALHARYSRDQILAAFGANSFEKKSNSLEGVVEIKSLNLELLFVTLQKSEKKFSPTTMYHDYAISEYLFHWQSQNAARPDKGKGLSYIEHQKTGKLIILFVRERSADEHGKTMGFVNLGPVKIESYNGSQPMNITWQLAEPLPAYLWSDAAKLAVG